VRDRAEQDLEVVEQALKGAPDGFRSLVERYQRPVFSIILRLVRDRATTEDLAQEAFLKAFRALDSFDRRRKFSSWLFAIAHNTAIDHLRKRVLDTVPLETGDDQRDPIDVVAGPATESPESAAISGDLARCFEVALAELRPEYAEVLTLRFGEGLAYDEIAEVVGLPLGTVKTHLYRARRRLADRLRSMGWGEDD